MNEENTRNEETMELTPAPENQETVTSKGGSTLTKVAIVGAAGAITGAVAFGLKKLKEHKEKRKEVNKGKMIEELKKKGWKIEEPETDEEELEEFETEVEDLNIDEAEEESK